MMITKSDIQDRLRNYPVLQKLFSKSLGERREGHWFRNEIIRSLYRKENALRDFEGILSRVVENVHNTSLIISKLNGSEAEFDRKIQHVYAEILAAKWFIDAGFDQVKFLEERMHRQTPDIELRKSGDTHFAEVKYLGVAADELTPILSGLEELVTEYPELYDKKRYLVKVQVPFLGKLRRIEWKKRDAYVDETIRSFDRKVREEQAELEKRLDEDKPYVFEIRKPLTVRVEVKRSDRFVVFVFPPQVYGTRLTTGTEFYQYGPLFAKMIGNIHSAYIQLLTNRNDDFDAVKKDFVYLFIEQRSQDILYEKEVEVKILGLLDVLQIEQVVQLITNRPKFLKLNEQICPAFFKTNDE
ncbi:MAG: hypothetical protein ACFFCW_30195 [Candidatus Hodarchaeota archaeon]